MKTTAIWTPQIGPQTAIVNCPVIDVLAGGARGGGKSDVLLGDIAIKANLYGSKFRALFLRRTLTEMAEIHRRAQELYPKLGATWMESKETWTFPNGATCRMTYIEDDRDAERYMGASVTYIAIDEAGNFPSPAPLDKLFGALRSPEGIPVYRRMTCNPGGVGHCIDSGDVLTPAGWRDIRDVRPGDPVFTVTASGEMVESFVAQVHSSWYEGELIRCSARGFYLSCTPNHSVAKVMGTRGTRSETGEAKPFSLVPFDSLPGQATILRSVKWAGVPLTTFTLPKLGSPMDFPARNGRPRKRNRRPSLKQPTVLAGEDYAALMGWFLSEGCALRRDSKFFIAQMKPEGREVIRALLIKCGFSFREDEKSFGVSSFDWMLYLLQFGKSREKWVPKEILNATEPVLRAFFDAAMAGDGHWASDDGGIYYTISRVLADQVAEVALKLGYIVYISSRSRENRDGLSYAVNFKKVKSGGTELLTGSHVYDVDTETKRRSDVRREPYSGPVYCLGIDHTHTFIVRQNGCVWVSGNSWIYERYIRHGAWNIRNWQPQPKLAPNVWVSSVFIPAKLEDNKILMENDPMYDARLAMVGDETLYRAWREGDWTVLAGVYFSNFDERNHFDCPEIKPWWPRYLAGDWGFSSWSAFHWGAWDGERLWVYREMSVRGMDPQALGERLVEVNNGDKIERFFFSHDAFSKRTSERSMAQEIADVFIRREASIPMPEPADFNRVAGWQLVFQGFRTKSLIISPTNCMRLMATIPMLVRDPKRPEDALKGNDDHWADSLRYLCASRLRADVTVPRDILQANFVDEVEDMNVKAMRARLIEAKGDDLAPVRLIGGHRGRGGYR